MAKPEHMDAHRNDISKQVTMKWLGDLQLDSWTKFLGKEWKQTASGCEVRIPPAYVETLLREIGLDQARSLSSPGAVTAEMREDGGEELSSERGSQYRRIVGKLMWMLPERPDLAYCTKELARNLAKPRASDWAKLKKLCRYLRGTSNAVLSLGGDNEPSNQLEVFSDSDWATGESRRSTSGGAILSGGWLLNSWSRTQPTVALSSCEAEFMAISTSLVEAKAVQSLARELGSELEISLNTDSSSAKALAMRRGFGRLKHMAVKQPWVQQEFREKGFKLNKVPTASNPADVLTKPVTPKVLWALAESLGLQLHGVEMPDGGGVVAELCGLEQHKPPVSQVLALGRARVHLLGAVVLEVPRV